MIRVPSVLSFLPYVIGAALIFLAGGELIGGYKVSKVQKHYAEVQDQIVSNAIAQARDLAQKWEEENEKSRTLKRQVDQLQGKLGRRNEAIKNAANQKEQDIKEASQMLSKCLIDDGVREILNDWMINESPVSGS